MKVPASGPGGWESEWTRGGALIKRAWYFVVFYHRRDKRRHGIFLTNDAGLVFMHKVGLVIGEDVKGTGVRVEKHLKHGARLQARVAYEPKVEPSWRP